MSDEFGADHMGGYAISPGVLWESGRDLVGATLLRSGFEFFEDINRPTAPTARGLINNSGVWHARHAGEFSRPHLGVEFSDIGYSR